MDCVSTVEHVTIDEKYEWVIWKDLVRCSRMSSDCVYCDSLRGSLWRFLYLYCLDSHTTYVSNGWVPALWGLFSARW